MTTFQPSGYSYGATDDEVSSGEEGADWTQYLPIASSILFGDDPREQYAKKQALLKTLKQQYNQTSSKLARTALSWKIQSLQAELQALEEQADEERTAVLLTQTGKIGGTVLLLAGAATLLMIGNYFRQKARTERALRKKG